MIREIRLTNWISVEKSLPPESNQVFPFLKRLEIPRSVQTRGNTPMFLTNRNNEVFFGLDCLPGVELSFLDYGTIQMIDPISGNQYTVEAGADIASNQFLMSDANGRAVPALGGSLILGKALTSTEN